ncbi:hypothetical protein [Nonomuraea sp. NPDC005650]|uniref:hypothetical protein n=1 Tax=Nonomuraea sp. NPDC005650 TaxID=3157045 RepID=UPI0033B0CC75
MPGTAQPRVASVTAVSGPFDQVDAPDNIQAGDTILAIITSTENIESEITGGSGWTILDERTDFVLHTRVYGQIAGVFSPSSYGVELDGDGMVAILHGRAATLAGIELVSDAGTFGTDAGIPCPAADGQVAAIEVRYVVGVSAFLPLTWLSAGYPVEDQALGGSDLGAYLGARTTMSSADLPVKRIRPEPAIVNTWQAWTLVVPPGDYVPPPPPVPAYAAKGRALYRYTAHDFLTGTYIDDIYPRDPRYSKRLSEPGTFTGSLPIPNSRVAAAVRRIIPKTRSDLTTGPGRVEIRVWRDGDLKARYWLTGARLTRGRDGKISVELRAVTREGFWHSLRVTEDLIYQDDQDQIEKVIAFLEHAQTISGADLGIVFQEGTSGVSSRVFGATKPEGTTYGRAVQEFARSSNGFEYFVEDGVDETGIVSTWRWGSPKIDTGVTHVFSSSPRGGDIAETGLDMDALRGGTDWQVRGGTPDGDATETRLPVYSDMVTTAHRAAGWPRLDHLVDHPTQSTVQAELDDLAEYYAGVAGGALWVRTVTVLLPKRSSLDVNSLGDTARLLITDVWHERVDGGAGLDISERIIAIEVSPTGRGRGREEAVLTLAAVEVP